MLDQMDSFFLKLEASKDKNLEGVKGRVEASTLGQFHSGISKVSFFLTEKPGHFTTAPVPLSYTQVADGT